MKKRLWELYYKLTLGKGYDEALANARLTFNTTTDSTLGRRDHFHNTNGLKIRGYHKKYSTVDPILL